MDDQAVLERKILTIVRKNFHGYKCEAAPSCLYTQSLNRFNVNHFRRHLQSFHPDKYSALILGKEMVEESRPMVTTRLQSCRPRPKQERRISVVRGKFKKVNGSHRSKESIKTKMLSIVKKTDYDYVCSLGVNCTYKQPLVKFNPGNFMRHMLTYHPDDCVRLNLCRLENETPPAATPDDEHVTAKVNKFRFLCGMVRLVTTHGLPLCCVSWQGMEDIITPLVATFKMWPLDEGRMRDIVDRTASQMQKMICEGMSGRMVALQLHGTMGRTGQFVVRVTCSFMREDSHICRQTLGVIVLDETSTCLDLEDKVNRIKERCGLEQWQIYTISIDYGRVNLHPEHVPEEHPNGGADDSRFVEILGQYNASLTDANVLQCGRHLLSMVATEATQQCADVVEEIVEMVKSLRREEHKLYIQSWQGQYPNIPDKNNYGFGTYYMMKALRDDRAFYEDFTLNFPGFALYMHWDFIDEFVTAFEPLHDCANRIGNCGLSDFHLQWLLAYGRVRRLPINRFKDSILKGMEARQRVLEELAPYKAALYMDPRLNFRGSKLFDHSKKEKIVTFLHSIYTMTEDTSNEDPLNCPTPSSSTSVQSQGDFSMNAYLTEMLGEGSPESVMEELIREIQQQERCDADDRDFDVVKYWAQKKMHDARLWTLARAVFAPLATHCGDADDGLGQELSVGSKMIKPEEGCPPQQLDDAEPFISGEGGAGSASFVKQNPNLLEKAILAVFFKDKFLEMEDDV